MDKKLYDIVLKVSHASGSGSCFYYRDKDIFVTNYHVVAGFKSVALLDRDENSYLAKVVLVNPCIDLAILASEKDFSYLPSVDLALDDSLGIGDKVFVAGYPYGMPFTVTEGTVSAPKQLMDGKYYTQTDAAVNPGNSGGPIFNEAGDIVGVTVSKFTNADNMGFAVPIDSLRKVIESYEDINRDKFHFQCDSCGELIENKCSFCPNCGEKIDDEIFDNEELSDLSVFCEDTLRQMNINPIIARDGYEHWTFHRGMTQIRLFAYDSVHLFAVSPIGVLPKKGVESILDFLLSEDMFPFKCGLDGSDILFVYRIHLTDLTDDTAPEIRRNIIDFVSKAVSLSELLEGQFGCEKSKYSKKEDALNR